MAHRRRATVTSIEELKELSKSGVGGLLRRMARWRVGIRWYAAALLIPAGITVATAVLNVLLGAQAPSSAEVGNWTGLLVTFLAVLLIPGLGGAWVRPELLAELHGNGRLVRCLVCDRLHTRQEVGWDTARWGPGYRTQKPMLGQPACPECGGRLISSVVNFGDPLPQMEYELAEHHARRCELMLVLGSSLLVQPAASLVGSALESGARIVLVNRDKTPYDREVTLRAWTGIGEVIPPAVERAKRTLGA
jgi:hypothetical protein